MLGVLMSSPSILTSMVFDRLTAELELHPGFDAAFGEIYVFGALLGNF